MAGPWLGPLSAVMLATARGLLGFGLVGFGLALGVGLGTAAFVADAPRRAYPGDPNDLAVKVRREMEAAFARPNTR